MSFLSVLALLLSFASLAMVYSRLQVIEMVAMVLLLIFHAAASFTYYQIAQTNVADAYAYYNDLFHVASGPIGLSTTFITQVCHVLKVYFGATYLDCFMIFQSVGFAGLVLLARTFFEIEDNLQVPQHRSYLGMLFLPSVIYWTCAIGKDAPVFFAIALLVWAALKLRTRLPSAILALIVLVFIRAHIALIAMAAFAIAALLERNVNLGRKMALLAFAIVALFLLIGPVRSSIDLDVTSVGSITTYLDQKNDIYSRVAGGSSLGSASYPIKVVSLLFRPFFFDAPGPAGIIASVENVGLILAIIYLYVHRREFGHLFARVFFVRFVVLFAFVLLFSLTLVYYNVGLGLRERIMAFPMFACTLVSVWSFRRKNVAALQSRPSSELMPPRRQDTRLAQR